MNNFKLYMMVGVGGIIGSTSRHGVSLLFGFPNKVFPYGTLTVNLLGCFILSFILYQPNWKEIIPTEVFTALTTGIIGSFTTFSTFALETVQVSQLSLLLAIIYISLTLFGGLICSYLGYKLAIKQVFT